MNNGKISLKTLLDRGDIGYGGMTRHPGVISHIEEHGGSYFVMPDSVTFEMDRMDLYPSEPLSAIFVEKSLTSKEIRNGLVLDGSNFSPFVLHFLPKDSKVNRVKSKNYSVIILD